MLHWLPENISSFGQQIDDVMYLIYYVVGVWFLVAEGVLLYFIFRYRRQAGVKAAFAPGRTLKTLAWVVVPAILVLICDLAIDAKGEAAWAAVKKEIPPADVQILVEARQFAWTIHHAGKSGVIGDPDNIVTSGELHVPVNKVVRFELQSRDVIHSFWVPTLRLKQDIVPGRTIPGWFKATKTGKYGFGCAQLCGAGHTVMGGTLIVHDQKEYDEWLKK